MIENSQLSNLFKKLQLVLRKVSPDVVISKLDEIENSDAARDYKHELKKFILRRSAKFFGVTMEDLKVKNVRGESKNAIKVATILIKRHLQISNKKISTIFCRESHVFSTTILKESRFLNEKIKSDKCIIDGIIQVEQEVDEYKKYLNEKYGIV